MSDGTTPPGGPTQPGVPTPSGGPTTAGSGEPPAGATSADAAPGDASRAPRRTGLAVRLLTAGGGAVLMIGFGQAWSLLTGST